MRESGVPALRHAAFVLFVLGIPFFAVAFADPRFTAVRQEATQPGRRIAILIDASGSMVLPFEAPRLEPVMDRAFYAAVAAAERFVRLRMAGGHNDIIGVVEFGNEAFVVTPFTTDYQNVILSLKLIGDPRAWNRFNVFGTTIIQGIDQGLQLFKTFDVLDASGNMMVIFSDGNDGESTFRGRIAAGHDGGGAGSEYSDLHGAAWIRQAARRGALGQPLEADCGTVGRPVLPGA